MSMTNRTAKNVMMVAATLVVLLVSSCDVHEFPHEGDKRAVTLELDFTDAFDWEFYKTVNYTRDVGMAMRFTIRAFRIDDNGNAAATADTTIVARAEDLENPAYKTTLYLEPGRYRFEAWADYTEADNYTGDYCYNADNFREIKVADDSDYHGDTQMRDAFAGKKDAVVVDNPEYLYNSTGEKAENRVVVQMRRPLAKYRFIATDIRTFLLNVAQQRIARGMSIDDKSASDRAVIESEARKIDINDFRVVMVYTGFLPTSFDIDADRPIDSKAGIRFNAMMDRISDGEVELGYDMVLVNHAEAHVGVQVEVYDKDGTLLSRTRAVEVPLMRGKVTEVRGDFLTSIAQGGVSVDPCFDGEYNIHIK